MKTWLHWVPTGPMLRVSLVPRLWPSPPRTRGDCLCLPLGSAIIMIIILNRGLIQLPGQINNKVPSSQSLYWTLLLTEGIVSKQPPPYPTSFDPQALSTHLLLGTSLGYPAVLTKMASPLFFGHWTGLDLGCAKRYICIYTHYVVMEFNWWVGHLFGGLRNKFVLNTHALRI